MVLRCYRVLAPLDVIAAAAAAGRGEYDEAAAAEWASRTGGDSDTAETPDDLEVNVSCDLSAQEHPHRHISASQLYQLHGVQVLQPSSALMFEHQEGRVSWCKLLGVQRRKEQPPCCCVCSCAMRSTQLMSKTVILVRR